MKTSIAASATTVPLELKHLQIFSPNEVSAMLDIHRATLYRAIKAKKFPPPQKITIGAVGWTLETLEAHLGNAITTK